MRLSLYLQNKFVEIWFSRTFDEKAHVCSNGTEKEGRKMELATTLKKLGRKLNLWRVEPRENMSELVKRLNERKITLCRLCYNKTSWCILFGSKNKKRKRERERTTENVCGCVCEREREWEIMCMCVFVYVCMCVCVYVCCVLCVVSE